MRRNKYSAHNMLLVGKRNKAALLIAAPLPSFYS